MQRWWLTGEASLEELLSDEIMGPVAASAGLRAVPESFDSG